MLQNPSLLFFFFFFTLFFSFLLPCFTALPVLPEPDPASIQQLLTNQSPPATIPAFPEQSDIAGCPLELSDDLFSGIQNACGTGNGKNTQERPSRSRCCPVLATWLYSAYSGTALDRIGRTSAESYDLPVLPDDSETCVDNLEKALKGKGIELTRPNETCDLVYCYCGIRLRPWSCSKAFSVSQDGKLFGDENVKSLERDCFESKNIKKGFSSLSGCSKCLNRLYKLNEEKSLNSSNPDRKSKMHNRDCQLMGLTWLLAKNRTAYFSTVSTVLRALMMSSDGSDPKSCTLNRDGMPLAVDSADLNDQSHAVRSSDYFIILSFSLICVCSMILSTWF